MDCLGEREGGRDGGRAEREIKGRCGDKIIVGEYTHWSQRVCEWTDVFIDADIIIYRNNQKRVWNVEIDSGM